MLEYVVFLLEKYKFVMTTNDPTLLEDQDRLVNIIDSVLSRSKKMGATDVEADIGGKSRPIRAAKP